ncbi:MAG: DUF4349 domain-containing protein [Nitrososphaerales archaeon]|nr:DUF4349 domain-containing protein [Nitrososphaerales archaeon]
MIKSLHLKKRYLVIIFILMIALSGYIVGAMMYQEVEFVEEKDEPRAPLAQVSRPTSAPAPKPMITTEPAGTSPSTGLEMIGRKIIYEGWLVIEVKDIDSTIEQIHRIVREMGGFVSQMSFSKYGEAKSATVTVRVPQVKFYTTLQYIGRLGELKDSKVSSQDVTEKYIDLEARLKNAQRQEQRLLQLLDRAQKVDEMLRIEQELTRVREQIELYMSQLRYLERRVEYSTITISLREPKPPPTTPPPTWLPEFRWDVPIRIGLQILFTVIQGLIVILFALIPISMVGLPTYYLYKKRKERRKDKI